MGGAGNSQPAQQIEDVPGVVFVADMPAQKPITLRLSASVKPTGRQTRTDSRHSGERRNDDALAKFAFDQNPSSLPS